MEEKNILSVKNLFIEYKTGGNFGRKEKSVQIVKNISFDLKEGKVLGIIGESGSGKTSLIKSLVGLTSIASGEIVYKSKIHLEKIKTNKEWRPIRKEIQMIFQNPSASLDPSMTIFDVIAEPLVYGDEKLTKEQIKERVLEIMHNVCLDESFLNKYSTQCSGGQNQRVAIARALIRKPRILLCDEPVSALDVFTQAQIMNLLQTLKKKYKDLAIIFISHDLNVVKDISDEIYVMYKGRIVEKSFDKSIFKNPLHPYSKILLNSIPGAEDKKYKDVENFSGCVIEQEIDKGCPLASICNECKKKCKEEIPGLKKIDQESEVACWKY